MSVCAEVEDFVLKELAVGGPDESIAHDEDLLASGIVDSHGLLQLVAFLRDRFGVTVSDAALTPENFQSIAAIDALVARERGGA